MKRPNWFQVSDKGGKAIAALHHYATTGTGLPAELIHLIFLRVSQINGCAHCIDIHTRDLIKSGMSVEKIVLVPVWREATYLFSDIEQAALSWAEEVTRVSKHMLPMKHIPQRFLYSVKKIWLNLPLLLPP
ncbi:TPA: carboxymuconolactone decarboxylase family protein [Enterobacter cloacae]